MRSSRLKVFWCYDCSFIIRDVICYWATISKIDVKLCEEFSFTKDLKLIHTASYVWLEQILIWRIPVNGYFQVRIFHCVLVNFSEKCSILAVIYLFTRNTSTSCEISSNVVQTFLAFLIYLFTWSQFHFTFLYFLLNKNW